MSLSDCADYELCQEARERGLTVFECSDGHVALQDAYEALLRGRLADAEYIIQGMLFPAGGNDEIKNRVLQDLEAAKRRGAHGQVGQEPSGGEANKNNEAA